MPTKSNNPASNMLLQHQAHLWISDKQTLSAQITQSLQQLLCKKQACTTCSICTMISNQQHPWIINIDPEGSYNLEDIAELLDQVKFKLDTNEYRFFIFHHAQDMTSACSNRLLKTIEEPHAQYHFVFLASRTDTILPTIVSRCFVKEFTQTKIFDEYHEIQQPFMMQSFTQPFQFLKLIEKLDIKEQASKDIIDGLIAHFHHKLKQLHQEQDVTSSQDHQQLMHTYMNCLLILKAQLSQLPLQGSSKIFWKNVYTTFHKTFHQ